MKNTCEPVDFLGKDWYRPATLVELFHRKFPNNLWNLSTWPCDQSLVTVATRKAAFLRGDLGSVQ